MNAIRSHQTIRMRCRAAITVSDWTGALGLLSGNGCVRFMSLAAAAFLAVLVLLTCSPATCLSVSIVLLIMASVVDIKTYRLPDQLTLPVLVLSACSAPPDVDLRFAGMILAPGLLWAVGAAFRKVRGYRGLGFGDVKLACGCGAMIGVTQVGMMLFVSAALALVSIAAFRGAAWARSGGAGRLELVAHPVAFGPYISLATILITLSQAQGLLN